MKQQEFNTNLFTSTAFSPERASLQEARKVARKRNPYLKPEISITYLQTEHSFVQASGKFSFTGNPNIEDMENGLDITTDHLFDWD
ncbi:MAG: hypothetical protein QM654_18285 [Dysgonamonadaceae bacterium]